MELHQIRYFLATCQTRNFTRAAEVSHVSQPALTKAIKLLEAELGGELIDRRVRPLQLTPLGQSLQVKFAAAQAMIQDIGEEARRFSLTDRREYTLGIVNCLPEQEFFGFVEMLQRSAPDIGLSIRSVAQTDLIDCLRDNRLELAIVNEDTQELDALRFTPLWRQSFSVAVGYGHPLSQKTEIELTDLVGVEMILRDNCRVARGIADSLDQISQQTITRIASDQNELVMKMVEAGLGVAVLPDPMIDQRLCAKPLRKEGVFQMVGLAEKQGASLSPPAQRLKEIVISQARATA